MRQEIPPDNNCVRTAGKMKWTLALDDETVVFSSELFLPRKDYPPGSGPEEYVSVDWLECFSGSTRKRLNQIRSAVAARRDSKTVGKQEQFATVLVRSVHEAAAISHKTVSVSTAGEDDDPSHSGIYGLEPTDHIISQEIARRAKGYPAYE